MQVTCVHSSTDRVSVGLDGESSGKGRSSDSEVS